MWFNGIRKKGKGNSAKWRINDGIYWCQIGRVAVVKVLAKEKFIVLKFKFHPRHFQHEARVLWDHSVKLRRSWQHRDTVLIITPNSDNCHPKSTFATQANKRSSRISIFQITEQFLLLLSKSGLAYEQVQPMKKLATSENHCNVPSMLISSKNKTEILQPQKSRGQILPTFSWWNSLPTMVRDKQKQHFFSNVALLKRKNFGATKIWFTKSMKK